MFIQTSRFGEIEVQEKDMITFVSPVLGFANLKKYVIINALENSLFQYMQSLEDKDLTFVLADPFQWFPDYEFELERRWLQKLKLKSKKDVDIWAITTLRSSSDISINLKAPIVINTKSNEAAQIILEGLDYPTRYSLIDNRQEEMR
ncbi:flagellar assembly protein FliW [Paenibacillus terreus]|uniref:Flagellar assembly factor FliW n=1 Tax=Paenibacillus terreus TaxID=1387834 RepID=A0ABV5B8Z9_9BACL